jgi:hypothetical protein
MFHIVDIKSRALDSDADIRMAAMAVGTVVVGFITNCKCGAKAEYRLHD